MRFGVSPWLRVRFSLRAWLFALSLVAMLPLLLFSVLSLSELEKRQRQSTLDGLNHHAQDLASKLDGKIQGAIGVLDSLAASAAVQRGDLRTLYDDAQRLLASNPDYRAITLIDVRDSLVFVTSLPFGADTFPVSHVDLVHEAFRSGKANLSGPFVTPLSSNRLVAVSVPLRRDGEVVYVLRLVLLTSTVNRWLSDPVLPSGWLAGIVDRHGTVLARSEGAEHFIGKRTIESALQAMKEDRRLMYPGVSLDGRHIVNVIVPIHGGDWFLGVAVPCDVLEAPLRQRQRQFAVYALLGALLSLGLSQWLARFLSRQVRTLSEAVAHGSIPAAAILKLRVTEFRELLKPYRASWLAAYHARQGLFAMTAQRDAVEDLYDNAPCGYHSLDREGRVLHINQTELGWLGRTRDEVVGHPFLEFLTEAGQQQFRQNFSAFLERGQVEALELELRRRDGSSLPVMISTSVIKEGQGKLASGRITVVDITERKRIERALMQANDELRRQREQIGALVQERTRILAEALECSESEQLQLEAREFDLAVLLDRVARQACRSVAAEGLPLVCEFDPALPRVLVGDSERLQQVLSCLLDNAGKFSAAGQVTLRAIVTGRNESMVTLRLEVEDQGLGISDEQLGGLFTLFQQGGTGLALCQRLVRLMGGDIGVDRLPDRGSRFWFRLALPLGQGMLADTMASTAA